MQNADDKDNGNARKRKKNAKGIHSLFFRKILCPLQKAARAIVLGLGYRLFQYLSGLQA